MGGGVSKDAAYKNQLHASATTEQKSKLNARVHHTSAFIGGNLRKSFYSEQANNAFIKPHDEILDGVHTKVYKDGSSYTGEFVQSHRHGKGVQTWDDGSSYDGNWVDDRKHGLNATWIFKNGDTFKGELCEGHLSGSNSSMTYANGDEYIGNFGFPGREGMGRCVYANGSVYEGNWHMDNPHGKGSYDWSACEGEHRYPKFLRFEGTVFSSQLEGKGLITFTNGDVYQGHLHADHVTGTGHMKYADGTEYNGTWHADMRQGTGTQTYSDGTKYTGEFHRDLRHGHGVLCGDDGQVLSDGVWKEDLYVGPSAS